MGGGNKKKEKKKKKKRHGSDEDDSRREKFKSPPATEEYVYDYSGQEMVHGSRAMSVSPEPDDKYSRGSRSSKNYDADRRSDYRDRSPMRKEHRKELNSPPPPPGTDWPYEKSAFRDRSPGMDGDRKDWKHRDDIRRDEEYQEEVNRKYRAQKKEDRKQNADSPIAASTNDNSSLSIEETNKLRIKLGLKPLDTGSAGDDGTTEKSYADREDVHKPATNMAEKKHSDKMRERMEAIREKRKVNRKLKKVKGIAEDDDPVIDSAAAWVARSRGLEREKELAEKRAQMLEEMDEEFGISGLIEQTVGNIKQEPRYTSRDLKGLTVQHKGSTFQEGSNVILTLEDKDVLDEDMGDVLINVNIKDNERAKKNVENRTKRPGYKAYDEVDDETGMLKVKGVLDKYDEEIDGVKKTSFKLDGVGQADGSDEVDRIRQTLKAQQVSLEMAAPSLARDYFTEEEMVKFKKPRKKVRKVRKRDVLKADDLLRLDVDSLKDRGSRKSKGASKGTTEMSIENSGEADMDIVPTMPDELDYFVAVSQQEEPEPIVEDDEVEKELQMALERSRRSKVKKENQVDEEDRIEQMALGLLNKPKVEESEVSEQSNSKSKKKGRGPIVLDSTSEFCRTLGELPTVVSTKPKVVEENKEEEEAMEVVDSTEKMNQGGWEQVEMTEPIETSANIDEEEDDDVLEAEPIPHGLVATLNLANMKGYLKDGKEKVRRFDPLNLPETKASIDVDKLRDEEKGRYARGYDRGDRYDPYSFKEKSNYKPEIKLDYVDNKGRQLNQKEAFRLLSHKFHGKGSGKLKTEKRAKKIQEEKKLQMMSSIDTPLNTASMFKEKQRASQSAYLVLSGGGKNLLSGNTLKK